jgi:Flp pilus assembly protein TadG
MTRGKSRDERGSLTVELVVVTPVLFVMALTVIVFGRISEAHQQVIEASTAAAAAHNQVPLTSR